MQTGSPSTANPSASARLTTVREQTARLQNAVLALREEYGDTLGVRRLISDVRRLAEDLDELGPPGPNVAPSRVEILEIPDTPYDRSMWADAEDEGLGAPDRRAP